MKDELKRAVENITKEINNNDIEIKRLGELLKSLIQEFNEVNKEFAHVVFAVRVLDEAQASQTENSAQEENRKHETLHERRSKLLKELSDIEESQSKLISKNYKLEETKAKQLKELRKDKIRTHIEKDLIGVLNETTGCDWIQDAKKYGENIFASEPFQDENTAKRFYLIFKAQIDNNAELGKSPSGHYRIFTKRENVLEGMVNRGLLGGFATDIRPFFDKVKAEKPERKVPPVR